MNANAEFEKHFFRPVCSEEEIERIFNVANGKDYLLELRAETIVDHMRLFRVYRNKALADEKKSRRRAAVEVASSTRASRKHKGHMTGGAEPA